LLHNVVKDKKQKSRHPIYDKAGFVCSGALAAELQEDDSFDNILDLEILIAPSIE